MMLTSVLCLFILNVEAKPSTFMTRHHSNPRKLDEKPAESKDSGTHIPATQKFKLFRQEGKWKSSCDIRGLALGGWFVPEKFINIQGFHTPDMPKDKGAPSAEGTIYEGQLNAPDVCTLSKKLGRQELDARMKRHLADFITEADFKYIASTGVNTLRIPVAYWNVVEDPYQIYAPINPSDSLAHLDNAMQWAEKYDLAVILDLHASPGSQNGWEHSGCSGKIGLFQGKNATKNQALSVEVVGKLAQRYAKHPALLGIEIVNEPTGYQIQTLMNFYKASYDEIRKYDQEAWVIAYAHNADRAAGMDKYSLHNFVLDKHEYACFGDGRTGPPGQTYQHHKGVVETWKSNLNKMNTMFPTILGEWSLCHGGGSALKLADWNKIQQDAWQSSTVGSVFWTYKTMTDNARWSYRVSLDTVDVMGELPRCHGEPTAVKKTPKFMLHDKSAMEDSTAKSIDAGYEWELELEEVPEQSTASAKKIPAVPAKPMKQ